MEFLVSMIALHHHHPLSLAFQTMVLGRLKGWDSPFRPSLNDKAAKIFYLESDMLFPDTIGT